jgi:branched-chain amino acid transport system substrate-binding protein
VLAEHGALGLRHLDARQRHRQGAGEIRRRQLVLPDRGLCVRHALERDTAAVVTANGGKVLAAVKHPLNNADFSSFLLQAQSSKAKIIGLANAGGDTTNAIKQAAEFGIVAGGQKLAGMLLFITDVHSLGLNVAQGLNFTETFYWDMNDQTRAFTKRFNERYKKSPPTHGAGQASIPR